MQEVIVIIIVSGCVFLIIRRIVQYFKRINHQNELCNGCSGCDIYKKNKKFAQKSKGKNETVAVIVLSTKSAAVLPNSLKKFSTAVLSTVSPVIGKDTLPIFNVKELEDSIKN